jgi:hypothetical protein
VVGARLGIAGWLSLLGASTACTIEVPAILPPYDLGDDDESADDVGDDEADDGLGDAGDEWGGSLDFGEQVPAVPAVCEVQPDSLDGPLPCELPAPSDAIMPVVDWSWTGPGGETSVVVTPLVANFDDDDQGGTVDLCDRPDVVVIAVDLAPQKDAPWPAGHVYVLDGDDGVQSRRFDHPVDATVTPAIGDLDGDGDPELVAMQAHSEVALQDHVARRLVVFEHDGSVRALGTWSSPQPSGGAIAIADLDADGSPELLAPGLVADAAAVPLWWLDSVEPDTTPVAADLDLDGTMEVLIGGNGYRADGTEIFDAMGIPSNAGAVAIANFDEDPFAEIYVQADAHWVLEHDGTVKTVCPSGGSIPVVVDDLDGDGQAEILHAYQNWIRVLEVFDDVKCQVDWAYKIDEAEARSSGTAFDLLGDGELESIYADHSHVRVLSSEGQLLAELPRTARSSLANPIVADVDADGAADIVVVGSEPLEDQSVEPSEPTSVMVLRNADDRFAPARRIWNQHTYHATNVTEVGRMPIGESPHWLLGAGFRTNAIPETAGTAICQPPAQP